MLNKTIIAHLRMLGYEKENINIPSTITFRNEHLSLSVYFSTKRNKWDTVYGELFLLMDELNVLQERLSTS